MGRKRRQEFDEEYQSVKQRCHALFVDTNLGTHFIVELSDADTVLDIKRKIMFEHPKCHPNLGEIKIDALMVERRGYHYHLSDSMLLKQAFSGIADCWVLFANISSHVRHFESPDLRGDFIGKMPPRILLDRHDPLSLQLVISRHEGQRISFSSRIGSHKWTKGENKKNEVSDALAPTSVVAHMSIMTNLAPESISSMPNQQKMHNMTKNNYDANQLDLVGSSFDVSHPQENGLKEADYDLLIRHSSDSQEGSDPVVGLPQNCLAVYMQSRRVNKKNRVENDNDVDDHLLGDQPLLCNSKKEMGELEARAQKGGLEEGSVHLDIPIEALAVTSEDALEENLVKDVSEGDDNRVLNSDSVERDMKTATVASPSRVNNLRRTKKNNNLASSSLLLMEESDNMKNRVDPSKAGNILADIHDGVPENTAYAEQEISLSNNKGPEVVTLAFEQLTSDRKEDDKIKPGQSAGIQHKIEIVNKLSELEAEHLAQEAAICQQYVDDETRNTDQHVEPCKIRKKLKPSESNLEARNDADVELGSSDHMKYKLKHSDSRNTVQENHHVECERVANAEQKGNMGSKPEQYPADCKKEGKEIKSGGSTTHKQKTRKVKNSAALKAACVIGMTDSVSVPCASDEAAGISQNDMEPLASTQLPRAEVNTAKSQKSNKKSKRRQTVEENNLSGFPMKDQVLDVRDLFVEGKMEVVGGNKTSSKIKLSRLKLEGKIDKDVVHESSHRMKTRSKNIDAALNNYQLELANTDNPDEFIELSMNTEPKVIISEHGHLTSDRREDKEFKSGSSAGKLKMKKDKNSATLNTKHFAEMAPEILVDRAAETSQETLEPLSLTQLQAEDNVEEKNAKPKKRTKRKLAIAESKISGIPVKEQDSRVRDPSMDGKINEHGGHITEGIAKLAAPDMVVRSDKDRQRRSSHGTAYYTEISKNDDVLDIRDNEPGSYRSVENQSELQRKNDPEVMISEEGLLVLDRKEDEVIKSGRPVGKNLNTMEGKKSAAHKTRHLEEMTDEISVDEAAVKSQKKLEPVSLTLLQDEDDVKEKSEKPKKRIKRKQATADYKVSGLPAKEQDKSARDSSMDCKIKEVSIHNTDIMAKSAAPGVKVTSDKEGGRGSSHGTTSYTELSKNEDVVLDIGYIEPRNYGSAELQVELQKKNDPEIMMSEEGLLTSDRKENKEIKSGRSAGKRQKTRKVKNSAAPTTRRLTQVSAGVLVDEVDHPTQKNLEPESSIQLLKSKLEQHQQTHPKPSNSRTEEAVVPQRINGPKKKHIVPASMADENETSMTPNGGSAMLGACEQGNGQKSEFKKHQVGSSICSYKQKEDVPGGLLQRKSVLASSSAIFMNESGSSKDESGYHSDSSTRTPSELSSTNHSRRKGGKLVDDTAKWFTKRK